MMIYSMNVPFIIIAFVLFLLPNHFNAFLIIPLTQIQKNLPQHQQANVDNWHGTIQLPTTQLDAAVGIFYGTSTGNTYDCAEKIYQEFGNEIAASPIDIDSLESTEQLMELFQQHQALIVGTPTWNTGADQKRSGTGWDEIYYTTLPTMKSILTNKKVAVFGLGDQNSYGTNFADATGELYDVFSNLGCHMIDASWSQDGYEHEKSKSIRNGKFCGLILDMINQEDLTEERIQQWVQQLKENGILKDGNDGSSSTTTTTRTMKATVGDVSMTTLSSSSTTSVFDTITPNVVAVNGSSSSSLSIEPLSEMIYTGYYNSNIGKTMWISPDGKKSFFTTTTPSE